VKVLNKLRIVKNITGDNIKEKPENFEIVDRDKKVLVDDTKRYYVCICSENTCHSLYIIFHNNTNSRFAIGSVCYGNIDDTKKNEVKQFNKSHCHSCSCFLNNKINYNKIFKGFCKDCFKSINPNIQLCLDCLDKIPKNPYRPRCMGCWKNYSKPKYNFLNDDDDV
jgi:hypothetical protein